MRYTLAIAQQSDLEDTEPIERSFDQDTVRIGRNETNDVELRDAKRLVSGRHAELRRQNECVVLVDVGSKNGTRLNEQPLVAGTLYPLKPDDRITIGDFIVRFVPVRDDQVNGSQLREPEPPEDRQGVTDDVVAQLLHCYWEHASDDPIPRKTALVSVLRDALRGVDPDEAMRTLDLIAARFSDREAEAAKLANRSGTVDTESSRSGEENEMAAVRIVFQRVLNLASQSVEKPDLNSGAALEAFLDRLERAWRIMLEGLADSVKGRRQFESEFDASSTRIFSWKPNPVKHAESGKDLGAYLLDWRRPESGERVAAELKDVFTDLALHQMGLMAGFKESVRGLLDRLDPERIENEAREGAFGIGTVKPFGARVAWEHFKEVHRALSEEEVKTFETVLGPHFVRGYLSVQRKKA